MISIIYIHCIYAAHMRIADSPEFNRSRATGYVLHVDLHPSHPSVLSSGSGLEGGVGRSHGGAVAGKSRTAEVGQKGCPKNTCPPQNSGALLFLSGCLKVVNYG